MQSHDFASTYVGTPFYMSPEICAAERYTLKSDIWSLGCIIYELCSREPPFNAKSHFQLVQKIKEGKISPIPSVYSPDLMAVIKDCLKVNPDRRPDTAQLLNLPVVKLMRKEKEVVELGRMLKTKEDIAAQRLQEAEEKVKKIEAERVQAKQDIEAIVRREWEVKARLEIDRQVQLEIERLQKKFDAEVQRRVETELSRRSGSIPASNEFSSSLNQNDIPLSSVSTNGDGEFPSTTDLTELSIESPEPVKAMKKSTRTPFARAQTMFAGTPMDIEMAEPSPMSIASLSLSPRRNCGTKAPSSGKNIFTAAGGPREVFQPTLTSSDSEDEEDLTMPQSPTLQKSSKNPFKAFGGRLALVSQNTAPVHKLISQPNIFAAAKANSGTNLPASSSQPDLRPATSNNVLKERPASPNRRLSKIPSSANVGLDPGASPTRKPSFNRKAPAGTSDPADLNKLAIKNNMAMKANVGPRGRTLVELAQARAGGRPVDSNGNVTDEGSPKGTRFADRMAQREREAPTWDPERDEMPSPFLVRQKQPGRRM
jgi:serine/threonine protein kinase